MGFITAMKNWAKQPFSSQMDLWGWILFVGLLLVIAAMWGKVLNHVVE